LIKYYNGEDVILPIKYRKKGVSPRDTSKDFIASDGVMEFYPDGSRQRVVRTDLLAKSKQITRR